MKIQKKPASFGAHIGKGTGSGNAGIESIEDVRVREVVPEIPATEFKLTDDKLGQRIRKKRTGVRLAQISLQISGGKM